MEGKQYCCELNSRENDGSNSNHIEALNIGYKLMSDLRKEKVPSTEEGCTHFWQDIIREDTMRNRTFFFTIILSLLFATSLFIPTDGFAKLYKWVDENGGVHWSDKPPGPDEKVKETTILESIGHKKYENLTTHSEISAKIESLQETLNDGNEKTFLGMKGC